MGRRPGRACRRSRARRPSAPAGPAQERGRGSAREAQEDESGCAGARAKTGPRLEAQRRVHAQPPAAQEGAVRRAGAEGGQRGAPGAEGLQARQQAQRGGVVGQERARHARRVGACRPRARVRLGRVGIGLAAALPARACPQRAPTPHKPVPLWPGTAPYPYPGVPDTTAGDRGASRRGRPGGARAAAARRARARPGGWRARARTGQRGRERGVHLRQHRLGQQAERVQARLRRQRGLQQRPRRRLHRVAHRRQRLRAQRPGACRARFAALLCGCRMGLPLVTAISLG